MMASLVEAVPLELGRNPLLVDEDGGSKNPDRVALRTPIGRSDAVLQGANRTTRRHERDSTSNANSPRGLRMANNHVTACRRSKPRTGTIVAARPSLRLRGILRSRIEEDP